MNVSGERCSSINGSALLEAYSAAEEAPFSEPPLPRRPRLEDGTQVSEPGLPGTTVNTVIVGDHDDIAAEQACHSFHFLDYEAVCALEIGDLIASQGLADCREDAALSLRGHSGNRKRANLLDAGVRL